jgi:CheY-like chemotaxis protein
MPHDVGVLTGFRILVVDDNDDTRRLLSIVLEQAGAIAIARDSVSAALKVFEEEAPPELVITDIQLLQRDGYELIGAVRALPADRGGEVPAIAVSGDTDVHTRKKVERSGFDLFLPKPVEPGELLTAARAVLGSGAARG